MCECVREYVRNLHTSECLFTILRVYFETVCMMFAYENILPLAIHIVHTQSNTIVQKKIARY